MKLMCDNFFRFKLMGVSHIDLPRVKLLKINFFEGGSTGIGEWARDRRSEIIEN